MTEAPFILQITGRNILTYNSRIAIFITYYINKIYLITQTMTVTLVISSKNTASEIYAKIF